MQNKVKNIIVLGIVTLVISTITVTAALVTSANNITFSSDKTDKTNVNEALDELYNKVNDFSGSCGVNVGTSFVFGKSGTVQYFNVPCSGKYKIELWGAGGGTSYNNTAGGNGAYTSGNIILHGNQTLYIYVGGKGTNAVSGKDSLGGYNGGGLGTWDNRDSGSSGAGGGSTDIRLFKSDDGLWNNFESLKSRIMVAGAGGGASHSYLGASGGGLIGYSNHSVSIPGSQTSGYKFGIGRDGWGVADSDGVAGGGSGYYGGQTSNTRFQSAGAGGSSFISGHQGCDAIDESSTEENIIHTGQPNHYSGYVFSNTVMVDGSGYSWATEKGEYTGMPSFDGLTTMAGNSGDGYAKITFLNS